MRYPTDFGNKLFEQPSYTRFDRSQVAQDFSHQQYLLMPGVFNTRSISNKSAPIAYIKGILATPPQSYPPQE